LEYQSNLDRSVTRKARIPPPGRHFSKQQLQNRRGTNDLHAFGMLRHPTA